LDHGVSQLDRSAAQTTAQQRTISLGPVERADLKEALPLKNLAEGGKQETETL